MAVGTNSVLLGSKDRKNYYLDVNVLTKEKSVIVDDLKTGKRKVYTDSEKMKELVCMFL